MVPLIASQKQQAEVLVFIIFTLHFRTSFPNMTFPVLFPELLKGKKKNSVFLKTAGVR